MKLIKDNKGMTLVEMIIGILILAIAGVMLAESFAATANIANRATLYKNASSSAAATVELDEAQEAIINDYNVSIDHKMPAGSGVTVSYQRNGTNGTFTTGGQYLIGTAESPSQNASLSYREFLSSNFSFEVPAEVVD